jgi:hypothetical protein
VRVPLIVALLLPLAAMADDSSVVTPTCEHPARLEGNFDGSPSIIVMLKADTPDYQAVAVTLSRKYGFKLRWGFRSMKGFIADLLSPAEIAKLRCEPEVETVSYDQRTSIT